MAHPLQEILVITDAGAGKVTLNEVQTQLGKLGLQICALNERGKWRPIIERWRAQWRRPPQGANA